MTWEVAIVIAVGSICGTLLLIWLMVLAMIWMSR